jgi:hypothetical protein
VEEVALVRDANFPEIPEMMVRVADGKIRFQRFLLIQGQPVISSEGHSVTSAGEVAAFQTL